MLFGMCICDKLFMSVEVIVIFVLWQKLEKLKFIDKIDQSLVYSLRQYHLVLPQTVSRGKNL